MGGPLSPVAHWERSSRWSAGGPVGPYACIQSYSHAPLSCAATSFYINKERMARIILAFFVPALTSCKLHHSQELQSSVIPKVDEIYSNWGAFVALNRAAGTVVCWGDSSYGGNCGHVSFENDVSLA